MHVLVAKPPAEHAYRQSTSTCWSTKSRQWLLLQGKLLAGVHSRVQLFKWSPTADGSHELAQECGHSGHVMALYIATRGDFILVGGLPFCNLQCMVHRSAAVAESFWFLAAPLCLSVPAG